MAETYDIRDPLFAPIRDRVFRAMVTATRPGLVAGIDEASAQADGAGVEISAKVKDGDWVAPGDVLLSLRGGPKAIALAEDRILGPLMMASGWATRAAELRHLAPNTRLVCGGWKKIPNVIKPLLHTALVSAGVDLRMVDEPFVYIDKNYLRMFGGISEALAAASIFPERLKVVQLRGEWGDIGEEAVEALEHGADVLMVDTGSLADLAVVRRVVQSRSGAGTRIAFAGGVTADTLMVLVSRFDVYAVDIGGAILDAPLLDLRLDVEAT
ncbi:hypothetical protein [Alicyclobacillus sendaiensis]|uniref:Nicotinate-nucleotide pyrophosphorylase n=1 Tax=Alicyclobacillus sendaiensis PA2 TaxID=3029425 RepID=A0ABT6XUK0_ALISE|nr:hypothetical protein [Alicyclobacillus sendaiensis]MDI9258708.1 hypothetical protein [Alicyclobacillus sendaiensis PA2]